MSVGSINGLPPVFIEAAEIAAGLQPMASAVAAGSRPLTEISGPQAVYSHTHHRNATNKSTAHGHYETPPDTTGDPPDSALDILT